MATFSINLVHFEDINHSEASIINSIEVKSFADLELKAKKALNGLIETQDILFYLPQAKTFVNEDNFNKWSENLSKCNLDKFVIYCKKRINEPNWHSTQEKLDKQFNLDLADLSELLDTKLDTLLENAGLNKTATGESSSGESKDKPDNVFFWEDFLRMFEIFNQIIKQNCKEKKYEKLGKRLERQFKEKEISSHDSLQNKIILIANEIFVQIFDSITGFESKPNQASREVGQSINNGDIFYAFNDGKKKIYKFLMEVKTQATLPTPQNDQQLLIRAYNQINNQIKALITKSRAEKLIKQVFGYMQSFANHGDTHVYSLISTYEMTYVLYLNNNNLHNTRATKEFNLYISPPLEKKHLLRAIAFVLFLRHCQFYTGESEMKKELIKLRDNITKGFYNKNIQQQLSTKRNLAQDKKRDNANGGNVKNTKSQQLKCVLSDAYKAGKIHYIGRGRTSFVMKLECDDGKLLALKMVDVYKHAVGAITELENEFNVLQVLKEKNVSFVPKFEFIETISVYRTIGMSYIEGLTYSDFDEMETVTKNACLKLVLELHRHRITHGDLQPWNFIVSKSNPSIVYLIDFGRANPNPDDEALNNEYNDFRALILESDLESPETSNESIEYSSNFSIYKSHVTVES